MLDVWCGESGERPPIKLVGRIQDRKVPSEMYGMISALLLRSGEMGEDIAEALGYLGFPLPGDRSRWSCFLWMIRVLARFAGGYAITAG